jgi:hypothetical protein
MSKPTTLSKRELALVAAAERPGWLACDDFHETTCGLREARRMLFAAVNVGGNLGKVPPLVAYMSALIADRDQQRTRVKEIATILTECGGHPEFVVESLNGLVSRVLGAEAALEKAGISSEQAFGNPGVGVGLLADERDAQRKRAEAAEKRAEETMTTVLSWEKEAGYQEAYRKEAEAELAALRKAIHRTDDMFSRALDDFNALQEILDDIADAIPNSENLATAELPWAVSQLAERGKAQEAK